MSHEPDKDRYRGGMKYNRCGRSGLKLPAVALGFWHNFGEPDDYENCRKMVLRAFDLGITHFDLANNYGPPPGAAETVFGRILREELASYRDEIVISTKAGWWMWPGPYGDWGSRKYLTASLDQSLRRLGVDYVDIFYHHRPDPETPIDETMTALDGLVRAGKTLYCGVSQYKSDRTKAAAASLDRLGSPLLIHQPSYSMFNRWVEDDGLLDTLGDLGAGCIAFSTMAQGLLTNKYLKGIPEGSRASKPHGFLKAEHITDDKLSMVGKLNEIARERGQSLAQMAVAWVLRDGRVTTALVGASRVEQIEQCVAALENTDFSAEELATIEAVLAG